MQVPPRTECSMPISTTPWLVDHFWLTFRGAGKHAMPKLHQSVIFSLLLTGPSQPCRQQNMGKCFPMPCDSPREFSDLGR